MKWRSIDALFAGMYTTQRRAIPDSGIKPATPFEELPRALTHRLSVKSLNIRALLNYMFLPSCSEMTAKRFFLL
jgi:hypothetical protein